MAHLCHPARDKSGYLSEDTVSALATGVGGPVNIVRISGPQAFEAAIKLSSVSGIVEKENRKLQRCDVFDISRNKIDEALVVFFKSPGSFTGEDCVEFHLHGGSFIANQLLESLRRIGIRQALPGEFSFRAVRNGKISLAQAAAVSDLIASKNQLAASIAIEKMGGLQGRFLREIAEELKSIAALAEVGIDFMDQDIEEVGLKKLKERAVLILEKLIKTHGSFRRGLSIQEGLKAAFVGLPNAGKSSFFNALVGTERSIVSDLPGTTRDIVGEHLTLTSKKGVGITLHVQDTAGLRDSKNRIEKMGIERTYQAVKEADLVLFIVDASKPSAAVFFEFEKLNLDPEKTIGIFSKCDLVSQKRLQELRSELSQLNISLWLETSAMSGEGMVEAAEQVAEFCEKWIYHQPGELVLTRQDQAEAIGEAIEHLGRSTSAQESDLFAADLKHALQALSNVIGETLPEDILGRIFSQFCIGK